MSSPKAARALHKARDRARRLGGGLRSVRITLFAPRRKFASRVRHRATCQRRSLSNHLRAKIREKRPSSVVLSTPWALDVAPLHKSVTEYVVVPSSPARARSIDRVTVSDEKLNTARN